jgi:hypothetical protein
MNNFYCKPVLGYRAWRINKYGTGLSGMVSIIPWFSDQETIATCRNFGFIEAIQSRRPICPLRKVPNWDCSCGLYAWRQLESIDLENMVFEHCLIGAVMGWGKVILTERGWRASHARPIAFIEHFPGRTPNWQHQMENILAAYRLPLLGLKEIETYAQNFADPITP